MSFLEALILDQGFETELLLVYIYKSGTKKLALLSTVLHIYLAYGVGTLSLFCSSFIKFII